jgi:hypothetical protein
MTTSTQPSKPFDGQIFIDSFRIKWIFDGSVQCWKRIGKITDIPTASEISNGLLSSEQKTTVDRIPSKGGGFGIIVDPKLSVRTEKNPDGLLFGDIELNSESLDINCVYANGDPIPENCLYVPYSVEVDDLPPGFDINVKEKFLNEFCVELPVIPGGKGDTGDTGGDGDPGTGDGPEGIKGIDGLDAGEFSSFDGIILEDVEDIFDRAVVDLNLDAAAGKLFVFKSKIKSPASDAAAQKLIVSPIVRSVSFTDDEFAYEIEKVGIDDVPTDSSLGFLPEDIVGETEFGIVKLSEYIDGVIAIYRTRVDEISDEYDKEIEDFFKEMDDASRQKLDILTEELANCEFEKPVEFCLGISPADCSNSGGFGSLCSLSRQIFQPELIGLTSVIIVEDQGNFCEESQSDDLGSYDLMPGASDFIKYGLDAPAGSASLPAGGYMVIYENGALFDNDDAGKGYFVDMGISIFSPEDPSTITDTISFPTTATAAEKDDLERSIQDGELIDRIMAVEFMEDGGRIRINVPTGNLTGEIKVRVLRCQRCVRTIVDAIDDSAETIAQSIADAADTIADELAGIAEELRNINETLQGGPGTGATGAT